MTTTRTITGRTAITVSEMLGIPLRKYADAIEDERDDLTAEEARDLCSPIDGGDPGLVYVDTAEVAEAIDDIRIRALRDEAGDHGDDMQLLICERALDSGTWSIDDWTGGGHDLAAAQRARLATMTQAQARVECALVIANRRAQE